MKRIIVAGSMAAILAVSALALSPGLVRAADHGSMPGMQHGGGGAPPALDMMKMGDKVYEGKMGPWLSKVRLMDMKAHMKSMPGGMKSEGPMPNSHHIAIALTNAKTQAAVTDGSGEVTVRGPDRKSVKSGLMAMQGHFGVDVNLPKPGKYAVKVEIASGKEKGSAAFSYTVK